MQAAGMTARRHEIETAVLCDANVGQGMRGRDSRAYLTRPSVTQEKDKK